MNSVLLDMSGLVRMTAEDAAGAPSYRTNPRTFCGGPITTSEMPLDSPAKRAEAGFRVCPQCGKPIHLNADTCRGCGTAVPKR